MPILKNAKKALRVSKRKAIMNRPIRSRLKTAVDAAKKSTDAGLGMMSTAFSAIDKAVKNHIIHRKKAAHMKSQLAKVHAGASAAPAKKEAPKKVAEKKAAPKKTAKPAAKKTAAK